jgi:ZIP family zinc transporter
MLKAFLYGLVAGSALLLGAGTAVLLRDLPAHDKKTVEKLNKGITAFGAGVLLCTLSFDLLEDAFVKGGFDHSVLGFLAGALLFVLGDLWLDRKGSGIEFLLGALLDGVPESAVIGIGILAGEGLGLVMMIAVFLSNFPEGMSGAADMLDPKKKGDTRYSVSTTLELWAGVTAICALSSVAGYALLGHSSQSVIGFILAVAAGAILAMVTHTMIPEAFSEVRPSEEENLDSKPTTVRLLDKVEAMATVVGFLAAFVLSRITRG